MIQHDLSCRCALCRQTNGDSITQHDRDLLADEWERSRGDGDGEVRKLRAGDSGGPGSPRRIALQAIARARIEATAARQVMGAAKAALDG